MHVLALDSDVIATPMALYSILQRHLTIINNVCFVVTDNPSTRVNLKGPHQFVVDMLDPLNVGCVFKELFACVHPNQVSVSCKRFNKAEWANMIKSGYPHVAFSPLQVLD